MRSPGALKSSPASMARASTAELGAMAPIVRGLRRNLARNSSAGLFGAGAMAVTSAFCSSVVARNFSSASAQGRPATDARLKSRATTKF
jgi:hypothetical protein